MRIVLTTEDKLTYLDYPPVPAPRQQIPLDNKEHFADYDMLQELKTMFSQQAEHEPFQFVRAFHVCKKEEGLAVSLILTSLFKEYDGFVQNYNMHGMGKIVNEVHAMLKLHEQSLPKKDDTPDVMAIKEGRIQKANKNKKPQIVAQKGKGMSKLDYAPKPKIPPP
ncbi:hypothetical protein Tco_1506029 [Tanacetum coccineum]